MKNLLQQRHFRRVSRRLIVRLSPPSHALEENQKEDAEEDQVRRRKKSFALKCGKKTPSEENGISNRQLYTTFIPPLTSVARCKGSTSSSTIIPTKSGLRKTSSVYYEFCYSRTRASEPCRALTNAKRLEDCLKPFVIASRFEDLRECGQVVRQYI